VSKLRFYALEPATHSGQVIESSSYNPDLKTQLNISGEQTFTVVYKDGLNETAEGTNHFSALKVDIYAVYNDNAAGTGTDKTVKLTASIKDCSCCSAYMDADHTQWLSFMCYDLGATHNGDPFTPSKDIHGAKGYAVRCVTE
jgi:hypothetical protein